MDCARCGKKIEETNPQRRNCHHYFHYECLQLVCSTIRECPMCGADVKDSVLGYNVRRAGNNRPAIVVQ